MELYRDILRQILEREEFEIFLPKQKMQASEMIEMNCFYALQEIKEVLENEKLSDRECFDSIERIITVFEKIGSGIHGRHDFG